MHNPTEYFAQQEVHNIGCAQLAWIDGRYSTGFPDYLGRMADNGALEAPEHPLAYHNGHHARAVGAASELLGIVLGFSPLEVTTMRTTGRVHDVVQSGQRGTDEALSAEALTEDLKEVNERYGFSLIPPALIEMSGLAIAGTEPVVENGQVVDQMANRMRYPSKKAEFFAKGVASGDFSELYTPQGAILGHEIYREIQGANGWGVEPPMDELIDFQRQQVTLLHTYTYPLPIAEQVLATHRGPVTEHAEEILEQLEYGDITTWEQLQQQNLAFYREQLAA